MSVSQADAFLRASDEQGSHIYVKVEGETFIKLFMNLIEKQTQKARRRGILLSTLWSANALSRRVSLSKVPKDSLKVIDVISLQLGSDITRSEDFIFLPTPASLESILVQIERLLRERKGERSFLIIDSLSYLSRYFSRDQIEEFFHYLQNRMLEEDITMLVFDQDIPGKGPASDVVPMLMDHRYEVGKEGVR